MIFALKRLYELIKQFTAQNHLSPLQQRKKTSWLRLLLGLFRISWTEQYTSIDGEQIHFCSASPVVTPWGSGADVPVSSWPLYCLQLSPKMTERIKQGLGLGVGFFSFPSHILLQTLTTVMYLFFSLTSKCSHITIDWKKVLEAIWLWICFLFWATRSGLAFGWGGWELQAISSEVEGGFNGHHPGRMRSAVERQPSGASTSIAPCAEPHAWGPFSQLAPRHYLLFT